MNQRCRSVVRFAPVLASTLLLASACGSSGDQQVAVGAGAGPAHEQVAHSPENVAAAPANAAATGSAGATAPQAPKASVPDAPGAAPAAAPADVPVNDPADKRPFTTRKAEALAQAEARARAATVEAVAQAAEDREAYESSGGATDVGVTKSGIKLGSINMHSMPLGNVLVTPQVRGNLATLTSINDRGGILGRRLSLVDCDDGQGEVARAKACIKKLVGQDKIFSLITGYDWATASIHEDLDQYKLPYIGSWAYSQTEWQDPYMFPTHMSMVHEATANANWVRNTIRPKTYGLICLTSPEMQLACGQAQKVLDAAGLTMVKKLDVGISVTSMSAQILAMRVANPDHVLHYVINPATMAKFMLEATQQGYYPPMGISGNHLAAEVLGSLFGKHPEGRYWTNTTYKLWGSEFMATMSKYARGNKGTNHHIVQAGYVGHQDSRRGREAGRSEPDPRPPRRRRWPTGRSGSPTSRWTRSSPTCRPSASATIGTQRWARAANSCTSTRPRTRSRTRTAPRPASSRTRSSSSSIRIDSGSAANARGVAVRLELAA